MVTILYYLNDVEEGGETAFIVADNSTLNESVRCRCFLYLNICHNVLKARFQR